MRRPTQHVAIRHMLETWVAVLDQYIDTSKFEYDDDWDLVWWLYAEYVQEALVRYAGLKAITIPTHCNLSHGDRLFADLNVPTQSLLNAYNLMFTQHQNLYTTVLEQQLSFGYILTETSTHPPTDCKQALLLVFAFDFDPHYSDSNTCLL